MENHYDSFEDLWIWQEGMQICYEVYDCMKDCNDYKLRGQMHDSSISIPSNIAEGFELHTNRAFIRHLFISKGSAGELRTQVYIAIRQRYIPEERGIQLVSRIKRLGAGIYNFIDSRKKQSRRRPS